MPMEESRDVCETVWLPLLPDQKGVIVEPQIVPAVLENGSVSSQSRQRVPPIHLQWKNISYAVPDRKKKAKKIILKDVSGQCSGKLTAIMGPSGSGKTTLLNILTCYIFRNVSGEILINGESIYAKKNLFSYVMQDDVILPFLTVKELITVASHLKLPDDVTLHEKQNIVDELLGTFGLRDCMNTLSNNLSGGERKRVCIAQELVSKSPVLFLDEPTSGLDSQTCLRCVKLMKKLAEDGHTVICSIHQPSANLLNMFDQLYILSEGECIYQGTVPNLLPFLSSYDLNCPQYHNPADFVIEIASGTYGNIVDQLKLAAKQTPGHAGITIKTNTVLSSFFSCKDKSNENKKYASSPWRQFRVLMCRTYKMTFRDPLLTRCRFAIHVGLGLLKGLLYWRIGNDASRVLDNCAFLLCTLLFLLFSSVMPTLIMFPQEMKVFLREHHNNWHRTYIYYLAKTVVDLPIQIVFTLVFCIITYWMTDQPNDFGRFALFCLNCCLVSIAAQSVGIITASICKIEVAIFMAPIFAVPALLLSGYFIRMSEMPSYLQWLSHISFVKYNYQIIMQTIYGFDRPDLKCDSLLCLFTSPTSFLKVIGIEHAVVLNDVLVLIGYCTVLRSAAYFFMLWKVHYRQ